MSRRGEVEDRTHDLRAASKTPLENRVGWELLIKLVRLEIYLFTRLLEVYV